MAGQDARQQAHRRSAIATVERSIGRRQSIEACAMNQNVGSMPLNSDAQLFQTRKGRRAIRAG